MKATAIFIMFLIAGLFFLSCDNTQSSSGPVDPAEIGQRSLAKKPQEINFNTLLCAGTDLSTTSGKWFSNGLFEDMGDASSQATGHGPTLPPNLVEGELVLVSPVGTITIRFIEPHELPSPGFPVIGVREGTWVILSSTGGYSNLHGQGTIRIEVRVDLGPDVVDGVVVDCGGPPNLEIYAELNGSGHFAP